MLPVLLVRKVTIRYIRMLPVLLVRKVTIRYIRMLPVLLVRKGEHIMNIVVHMSPKDRWKDSYHMTESKLGSAPRGRAYDDGLKKQGHEG